MALHSYYVDLHIHIGRDWNGRPVKISGGKSLTLTNILKEASRRKGMDMVGVIDSHAPAVQDELEDFIDRGYAEELEEGGVRFENTTLILGAEVEIYDDFCQGPIHVLCYFPYFSLMKEFTAWLSERMKNVNLSSQRYYGSARELQTYVHSMGGWFIPAHVFTPFKSLYGKGVKRSLVEVLDPKKINAFELGLSSDTSMAEQIEELSRYTFVSNSDAHSLAKIGREYQKVKLQNPSFHELGLAFRGQEGRSIEANYGMNPMLGKYHETVCNGCGAKLAVYELPCPACNSKKVVKGVAERIRELASSIDSYPKRPPYIYQVPLEYLPSLGPKTYEILLGRFGTEMNVIHHAGEAELNEVIPEKLTARILSLRKGEVTIEAGGGGKYGKVRSNS
ncbi:TIGR00375 family protein [Thalassobacillus cyri]|uniref:TIGR00375 family protein n=1 Tax=Thalassobacillus cyri TaxID=571932 RepID=A0A1H4CFQ8_9BACI|nr:endonuclease Q family protein [Thalassobacillus cyri]SEA58902.1 TIGR00375 family protein [Thalassobacillus cyri]